MAKQAVTIYDRLMGITFVIPFFYNYNYALIYC